MKLAKIFIVCTFLLACAVCVSAQKPSPKIVWKNLQEKYLKFEDIKPSIINASDKLIYLDSYYAESVRLLKFNEKSNEWIKNPLMLCGTLSKEELNERSNRKFSLNPNAEKILEFDEMTWKTLIYGDGSDIGFKSKPSDSANGKYKFQVDYWFDISKKYRDLATSESPEFTVIESESK
jgi:hypothetical protein